MGAQVEARRESRRVLCGIAVAGIKAVIEAPTGRYAQGQAVSFLLDTNVVSKWIRPRPNAAVVAWLAQTDEGRIILWAAYPIHGALGENI
jgi:hypothetical protein